MTLLQTAIIEATHPLVRRFSWMKVALNTTFYTICTSLIVYVSFQTFAWTNVIIILAVSFAYLLIRDWRLAKQSRKILLAQCEYVYSKHPEATLFVPILDSLGSTFIIRRAALYFVEDTLYLEAFSQTVISYVPKESITVPYGKDFQIIEQLPDVLHGTMVYKAILLGSNYRFYTCMLDGLTNQIQAVIDASKEISDVNTP